MLPGPGGVGVDYWMGWWAGSADRGLRFSPRTYVSSRSLGFPCSDLEEKSVLVQEGRSRSGKAWIWGGDCVTCGGGGVLLSVVERGFAKSLLGQ